MYINIIQYINIMHNAVEKADANTLLGTAIKKRLMKQKKYAKSEPNSHDAAFSPVTYAWKY